MRTRLARSGDLSTGLRGNVRRIYNRFSNIDAINSQHDDSTGPRPIGTRIAWFGGGTLEAPIYRSKGGDERGELHYPFIMMRVKS